MRRLLPCLVLILAACDLPDGAVPASTTFYAGRVDVAAASTRNETLLVLGPNGAPAAGADVHLSIDQTTSALGLRLHTAAAAPAADSVTVVSDTRGVAAFAITYGSRAGRAIIRVRVPSIAYDDSLTVVLAGAPLRAIDLNPVSPLYADSTFVVTWSAYDSAFVKTFTDQLTLTVSDPTVAEVVGGDIVHTLNTGFTWIVAAAGASRDSVPLAVVPPGTLAAVSNGAWRTFPTTGVNPAFVFTVPGDFDSPRYGPLGVLAYTSAGRIELRFSDGSTGFYDPAAIGLTAQRHPSYSANGQSLYFSGVLANGAAEIWRYDPVNGARVGPAAAAGEIDEYPSASAGDSLLAFVTNRTLDGGLPTLRVVRLSDASTVYSGPAASAPRFAPTGTRVAFISRGELRIVNADGTGMQTLTPSMTAYNGQLAWSPDGRWIAVVHGTGGASYLTLVDTMTRIAIRLPYAFGYGAPEWR